MQKLAVIITLLLSLSLQAGRADNTRVPVTADTQNSAIQPDNKQPNTTTLKWYYLGKNDFEQTLPGYGVSYGFASEADAKANIYIYSLGKKDWKNGISDSNLNKVLQDVKSEIQQVQQQGAYQQASFTEPTQISIDGQDFYVQPVQLKTEYDQISSFVYLSVLNHQLLKFRISFINPPSFFDTAQISQNFIRDTLKDLNQAEQPASPPAGQVL